VSTDQEEALSKILVIDDDEQIRKLLRRFLEADGHDVLSASDAIEGMTVFREQTPGLVITDILMPDKDGIELIRDLRALTPDLKIIAISGGGSCSAHLYLASSRYLGASRTLAKPFDREELKQAVDELLGEKSDLD